MARILLVDDDRAMRSVAGRMLEQVGHVVLSVEGADEALEIVRQVVPDLVVCDLHLGDGLKNGLELHQLLRRQGFVTPFILSSGSAAEAVHETYILPPDVTFVEKPWTMEQLINTVIRVLGPSAAA